MATENGPSRRPNLQGWLAGESMQFSIRHSGATELMTMYIDNMGFNMKMDQPAV